MKFNAFQIISIIGFAVVVLVVVIVLCGEVINATNEIDAGYIVDKQYSAGGSRFDADKNGGHYYEDPPKYYFTIQGDKNGKIVEYSFQVTETEYGAYKIGDWYER